MTCVLMSVFALAPVWGEGGLIVTPAAQIVSYRETPEGGEWDWWSSGQAWFTFRRITNETGEAKFYFRAAAFNEDSKPPRFFVGVSARPKPQKVVLAGEMAAPLDLAELNMLWSYIGVVRGYRGVFEWEIPMVGDCHALTLDRIEPVDPNRRLFLTGRLVLSNHEGNKADIGVGVRQRILGVEIQAEAMTHGRYDVTAIILRLGGD